MNGIEEKREFNRQEDLIAEDWEKRAKDNPKLATLDKCDNCDHWKVEHRRDGRSDGEMRWCLAFLGQPNECECHAFVQRKPNPCEICGREKGRDERDCDWCIHD